MLTGQSMVAEANPSVPLYRESLAQYSSISYSEMETHQPVGDEELTTEYAGSQDRGSMS